MRGPDEKMPRVSEGGKDLESVIFFLGVGTVGGGGQLGTRLILLFCSDYTSPSRDTVDSVLEVLKSQSCCNQLKVISQLMDYDRIQLGSLTPPLSPLTEGHPPW